MTDAAAPITAEETLDQMKGLFVNTLTRGSKKIRTDRALSIVEATERIYRRSIEDLEQDIKDTVRAQANELDLSPTSSDSLELAKNFSAETLVKKDMEATIKLRNLKIALEEYKARYAVLFGETVKS